MLGWLTNSLSYQTKKALKAWQQSNQAIQEYQYNNYEKFFITLAGRPLRNSILIFLLFSFLPALPVVWNYSIIEFLWKSSETNLDKPSYLGTIWEIQAALVGLVYPIVIGFVGLLLQNRASEKVMLRGYLADSCAIFMSLSSLLLVAFIGIQYCIISYLPNEWFRRFFFSNGVWFVFNVIGTIWFLYRTVEFIKPDLRQRNIKRYVVNIIYPQEVEKLLKSQLFVNAQSNNWIPGVSWGSENARQKPSISMHSMLGEYGDVEIFKHFKQNTTLENVHFKFLWMGCKLWLIRASRKTSAVKADNEDFFGIKEQPSLLFPLLPGEIYMGDQNICRIIGSTKLDLFEKLLIKISFRFRAYKQKEEAIKTYDILVGYQSEVINALTGGQIQRYEDAIDDLENMYTLLINSGEFKNDDGQKDNWANLASSTYWSGRRLYQDWNRIYSDILDSTLNQLPSYSARYFGYVVYAPYRLYTETRYSAGKELSISFMGLGFQIWLRLRDLWVKEVENQGEGEHSFANPCELKKPAQNWYKEAVHSFVGSWEYFLKSIYSKSGNKAIRWVEFRELSTHFEQHLNYTLLILLNAVYAGDIFASEWLLDTLQKWRSFLSHKLEFDHYSIKQPQLITIDSLFTNEDEATRKLQDSIAWAHDDEVPPFDRIFAICVSNYWIDINCIALYILSLWARYTEHSTALPIRLIKILLSGESQKPGGEAFISLKAFSSPTGLFQSILRQYFYDGGYRQGYRNRLDWVIESVKNIEKPTMISGRIYSTSGADDLESTKFGQLFSLCLVVEYSWNPALQLESDLRELIKLDDQFARNLRELIESYLNLLEHANFILYENAYKIILADKQNRMSFQEARQTVRNGLNSILQVLDTQRQERIVNLEIDSNRLKNISSAASTEAFDKDKTAFPVYCFHQITPTGEVLEKKKLIFKKMNRGEFTSPLMAQLVSNESYYFSETMKNYVATVVLSNVLKQSKMDSVEAYDESIYWNLLRRRSARLLQLKLSPILLLDNPSRPEWIGNWKRAIYDKHITLPKGLRVYRKNNNDIAYLCNFNDIEVYDAPLPIGSSYLLAKEIFEELMVTDYEGARFFNAELKESYKDKTIVDLELEFAIRVVTKKSPAICLKYFPDHHHNPETTP